MTCRRDFLDKMIKWGAEVDPKDRDAMIDYFSSNFGPDQPVYAASQPKGKNSNRKPRNASKF